MKVPLTVFEPALQRMKDEVVRLRLGPRPDGARDVGRRSGLRGIGVSGPPVMEQRQRDRHRHDDQVEGRDRQAPAVPSKSRQTSKSRLRSQLTISVSVKLTENAALSAFAECQARLIAESTGSRAGSEINRHDVWIDFSFAPLI